VFSDPEFWKYVSIPFVAAIVGWITNWVAIKLTFHPLEFFGLRPVFGWQGIIPSKARKMAETFVDVTMSRLGSFPEVFAIMDPDKIAAHISRVIAPRLDEFTDEIMLRENKVLWENLPTSVRNEIYGRVRAGLPKLVDDLMEDVGRDIEGLIDFRHMIVTRLENDKALLNRLFLESGSREFAFIVRSGLYFGFFFGLGQLGVWIGVQYWWILPLAGLIVGFATNWIALNIIFRPLRPRKFLRWHLQGLFLKRQKEVAGVWCHIVTREILTLRHIVDAMLEGPRSERSRLVVTRHMKPLVEEAVGPARTLAQVAVGMEGFAKIKESVGEKALAVGPETFADEAFIEDRAEVLEKVIRERMENMPPEEFQDLLRPCFQEDEWKLILTGAMLGMAAGFAQLFFVFGGV
jgi:uncharacterized membrane protein YheB (UPF0754 family)